jgi:hypothetical protein
MARRAKPVPPPQPEVKPKGPPRTDTRGQRLPTFAEIESEQRQEEAQRRSSKRRRPPAGPSVSGSTRAARPRSGRSGSDSNA